MKVCSALCPAVLLLACGTAAAQPGVLDLGIAPGGPDSYAAGISQDGTVVVGSCNCSPQRAWRWTQSGGMVLLPLGPGAGSGLAAGVSADGAHTAGSVYITATNRRIPKFWLGDNGPLGFILPAPWDGGTMNDVSMNGLFYAGTLTNSGAPGGTTAVRMGNSVDIIPPVANCSSSEGAAMSIDGEVVAGTASQPGKRPFRWTAASGSVDLGLVPGAAEATALGLSADGSTVVGETRTATNVIGAFKWTQAEGVVSLDTSDPALQPRAVCTTADGSVVFGVNAYSLPEGTALVWLPGQPAVFLHDYLASLGADLTGWRLTGVSGVSSDGTAIAGTGVRAGVQHAYLVTGLPRLCGPVVTSPPQSQFCVTGGAAAFTVSATGGGVTSFQWLDSSGAPLTEGVQPSGAVFTGTASSVLNITNATMADATFYSCRVTDPCGSVVSPPGYLIVNQPCGQGQEAIPAGAVCDFTSQNCGTLFTFTRSTSGDFLVEYTAPLSHCSDVGIRFFLDGSLVATTGFLAPGESSGVLDLGPVADGAHAVDMEAFGREGGCNGGALEAWGGGVSITTSTAPPTASTVSSQSLACPGQPALYQLAVSGGGPSLVTWEISEPGVPGGWRSVLDGANVTLSTGAVAFVATAPATSGSLSVTGAAGFFDDWTGGAALVRARVQNSCGVAFSEEFPLTVAPACGTLCDSIDFNADGLFPDTADIDDFLSVFSGGPCSTGTCGDIDFNNDGLFPDTLDIDSLLSVFSGGPCL